jgi:ABC-2 type transport system permease protein
MASWRSGGGRPRTMPGWLQGFVRVNPISHLVAAVRSLTAGKPNVAEIGWLLIAGVLLPWSSAP